MPTKEKFIQAKKKIKKAKNILLIAHRRPDGDTTSSVCALAEYLEQEKKQYQIYCADSVPEPLSFLPHVEKFSTNKNLDFKKIDLFIALDCGSIERTALEQELSDINNDQYIIEFDHHPKIKDYSDLEIRNPKAASTTEVLYYFFKHNNITINKNIANCILTGIITDTGNFFYPSTTQQTIEISSEMLALGARLPVIFERTWRNKTLQAMKVWGEVISNLQINNKYNFAFSVLPKKIIEQHNIDKEELEGISGFLSNLHKVSAVMLLQEEENGFIKGSLRTSQENIDVSKLARLLGGGGHAKASGFMIKGCLIKENNRWKVL